VADILYELRNIAYDDVRDEDLVPPKDDRLEKNAAAPV